MEISKRNIKLKKKKNRRKRKGTKNISETIRFLGVNSAGIRSKILTFKKVIKELNPSVFLGRGATSIIGSVNPTVWLCGCVSRLGSMKSEL